MRLIAIILILVGFAISCSEDETTVLDRVDFEDAIGIYQVSTGDRNVWYKISRDGTSSELQFQSKSGAVKNADFEIKKVKNYLIATLGSLHQTYFIDKTNGKAYKSGHYFGMPLLDLNSCTDNACYYYSFDSNSIVSVKDYLSTSPDVSHVAVPEPAFNIMEDKDGMVTYLNPHSYLYKLDAGLVTLIMQESAVCSWMGDDGYRRAVDQNGDLYRITKKGNEYLHSYGDAREMGRVVMQFPSLSKELSVRVDFYNSQFVLHDLGKTSEPVTIAMPGAATYGMSMHSENYVYIFTGRQQTGSLTKINANNFEHESIEYVRAGDESVAGALADDFVILQDAGKLLRLNPDGTTSILATGIVSSVVPLH